MSVTCTVRIYMLTKRRIEIEKNSCFFADIYCKLVNRKNSKKGEEKNELILKGTIKEYILKPEKRTTVNVKKEYTTQHT